ncbi:hypothetical protein MUK42_29777 [Musa troglodytarum]|uniref:Uncharacterized protein n=1 Tax=Musa troglodytarum TaxID=320322 RepID=A0A9E7GBR9_9LILI|nr:hypothetical protein MUK42_29777 [Musa troglodytarum]
MRKSLVRKQMALLTAVLVWQGSAARKVFVDVGVPHYWDLAINCWEELFQFEDRSLIAVLFFIDRSLQLISCWF